MIAGHGRPFVLITAIALIMLTIWLEYWALPAWSILLLMMWFYRDPERDIPSAPLGIVSPADGIVTEMQEIDDPFLEREAFCISLKMSWHDVFTLRGVIEGKIMRQWLHSPIEGHTTGNTHLIWIQTDEQDDVLVALHTGRLLHRLHCYVSAGERIGQGKRCGFMPLGTQIDVILPRRSRPLVKIGQKVFAGADLLAELVH